MGAAALWEGLAGVGPVEGVGHGRVVVGNELSELGLEVGHRGEVAAAQALSVGDAEKDLDLVKPRAVFGQVHEADAVVDVREELAPCRQRLEYSHLLHASRIREVRSERNTRIPGFLEPNFSFVAPDRAGRRARPGRAWVGRPWSSTSWPLTRTWSIPVLYWNGSR